MTRLKSSTTRFHLLTQIQQLSGVRWLWLLIVGQLLLYAIMIWNRQSLSIDGQRIFWLQDDMMISMRYGRNWAAGNGLLWNPNDAPVEGYSNFLWVGVMTIIHWLPVSTWQISAILLFINSAIASIVLALTYQLHQRLAPQQTLLIPLALFLLLISRDLARWTTIGLEHTLLIALFLWLLLRILDEAKTGEPRAATYLLAGLLGLVRVDGFVPAALLVLLALLLNSDRKRVLLYAPLPFILPIIHVIIRLVVYGYPLPNTYYLKVSGWFGLRLLAGLRYTGRFLLDYAPIWLLAGIGSYYAPNRTPLALWSLSLPLAAYVIFVGGDDFAGGRFFAILVPILIMLSIQAVAWMPQLQLRSRRAVMAALVAIWLITQTGYGFWPEPTAEHQLVRTAYELDQLLPEEVEVAHFLAGIVPYFLNRPAVDLLGKNDASIAHQTINVPSLRPGHNKFDFTWSLNNYQPDLIIAPTQPSQIADPAALAAAAEGDFAFVGHFFIDSTFQQQYAANLIFVADTPLFIAADTPLKATLMQGDCDSIENVPLQAIGFKQACWPTP